MNEELPLVSVIIPTYNDTDYLTSAVQSALYQTYPNIEIIVVDDHSDEKAEKVIADLNGQDKISYIRHSKNRGGSAARNTGIDHSSGKYLAFLDADDIWLPGKISHQVPLLEAAKSNTALLISSFVRMDSDGGTSETVTPSRSDRAPGCPSRWLVRKDTVSKIGGFDEDLLAMQDNDFSVRLLSRYNAAYDSNTVAIYRVRGGSVSHNPDKTIPGREQFLHKHKKKLTNTELSGCYYYLSRSLLEIEDYTGAMRYALSAIKSSPYSVKNYVLFISIVFRTTLIYEKYR